jgi:hypothetical protein
VPLGLVVGTWGPGGKGISGPMSQRTGMEVAAGNATVLFASISGSWETWIALVRYGDPHSFALSGLRYSPKQQ